MSFVIEELTNEQNEEADALMRKLHQHHHDEHAGS
jgi:hypothetical protein